MSRARGESAISGFWSLTDLVPFYAPLLIGHLSRLMRAAGLAPYGYATEEEITEALVKLRDELVRVEASPIVLAEAERAVLTSKGASPESVASYCVSLCLNTLTDLGQRKFFRIRDQNVQYLAVDSFAKAAAVFTAAREDMDAARRCLAFEESNACVFHCMRVLERGLRKLAADVGVADFELENWKNIIDQIEKKIRKMEDLPKTPEKSESIQKYSEAAVQFRYFKDAWRNHVSHGHSWYDQDQARSVFNHVRQFMDALAR